jgi:hypothetical protein
MQTLRLRGPGAVEERAHDASTISGGIVGRGGRFEDEDAGVWPVREPEKQSGESFGSYGWGKEKGGRELIRSERILAAGPAVSNANSRDAQA